MKFALTFALAIGLAACAASTPRKPELPFILHNKEATKKVEILPGGHGTGVVIDGGGLILTCHHVAGEGERLLVIEVEVDGKAVKLPARVVAFDKEKDLAVIRVDYKFDRWVVFEDMDNVHEGDTVYNIGYPYSFGRLIDKGTISALHYDDAALGVKNGIVVSIDDGPGTSGSGMFAAASGKLIGIMKMMVWVTRRGEPPRVIRILTDARDATEFLDRNGIPYHTAMPAGSGGSAPLGDDDVEVKIRILTEDPPAK